MGKKEVRQEARALQGTDIQCDARVLHILGSRSAAEFESGSEGLVLLATDTSTGEQFRIKCFWEPDGWRRRRSKKLINMELPHLNKSKADALGGAPFEMLGPLGPATPFAVVMKNVRGEDWRKLRGWAKEDAAREDAPYPPSWWPPADIRATWGYGLATAVLKMEAREFIHADLSPGNVVVNAGFHGMPGIASFTHDDDSAGDMAVVDFDRYVHLPRDLPRPGQGSEGYAAPEIWEKQLPSLGTDRTALAILIQEFLVTGDPDITRDESFNWAYDQESRCFQWTFMKERERRDEASNVHPLLERKYTKVAKLLRDTLFASHPDARSAPEAWRQVLCEIVDGSRGGTRSHFRGLAIEANPIKSAALRIIFDPSKPYLDLSTTNFGIRANLERDANGSIFLTVHEGAKINVRVGESKKWIKYAGGSRIHAEPRMVLFDNKGTSTARFEPLAE